MQRTSGRRCLKHLAVPVNVPLVPSAATKCVITHFVAALGTSGTFTGTARCLRQRLPDVRCISVQPSSPLHGLEGTKHMPSAIKPGIYDPELADENMWVDTEDAYAMTRRL